MDLSHYKRQEERIYSVCRTDLSWELPVTGLLNTRKGGAALSKLNALGRIRNSVQGDPRICVIFTCK